MRDSWTMQELWFGRARRQGGGEGWGHRLHSVPRRNQGGRRRTHGRETTILVARTVCGAVGVVCVCAAGELRRNLRRIIAVPVGAISDGRKTVHLVCHVPRAEAILV